MGLLVAGIVLNLIRFPAEAARKVGAVLEPDVLD